MTFWVGRELNERIRAHLGEPELYRRYQGNVSRYLRDLIESDLRETPA